MRGPVLAPVLLVVERAVGAETFDLDLTMQRSVVTLDAPLQHTRLVQGISVLEHRVFELAGVRDATTQLAGALRQPFGIVPVDRLVVAQELVGLVELIERDLRAVEERASTAAVGTDASSRMGLPRRGPSIPDSPTEPDSTP